MSFSRFHTLLHHLNKSIKPKPTLYNHHTRHYLYTSSRFKLKSYRSKHIFQTRYSNQLNTIYSQCFNIIYNNIKRTHYNSLLFNKSYLHNKYHQQLIFKRFASMDVSKDYYKILSINKNATKKDIRSSYLKLAKQWHPDLHKNEKDKKIARDKFIEVQEAYEVLHDAGMRKKYDEMRRYGISQEQYKYQEAYQRQSAQSGFTNAQNRTANPYENEWEQEFRRNMHSEWEKIRREQQDWASARRAERHKYSNQFPFGEPGGAGHGFGQSPFGGAGGPTPFPGFGADHRGTTFVNPLEGFFRTMMYIFAFFLMFRLLGFMLFGPRDRDKRRPSPYGPYGHGPNRRESPFYSPEDYNKYNPGFPPPLSLRDKRHRDEHDRRLQRGQRGQQGPYTPPPPQSMQNNKGPRARNSLRDNQNRNSKDGIVFDEEDGNEYKFRDPSTRQTTDVSSPGEQRRKAKKKKSKYEKMLEEQRMMEDVYIRARKKQMELQEFERKKEMKKKFGRRPIQSNDGYDDKKEDVNEAWERYLNSKTGNEVNWRDRGRRNS